MDFGLVSLDSLVTSSSQSGFAPLVSDSETRQQKSHGSEFLKQERSFGVDGNDWRNLKKGRNDDFSTMLLLQQRERGSSSLYSDGQQQEHMLSFSSPKSDPFSVNSDYYHSAYTRNAGLGPGSWNTNMHGALTGARGPFTPSQWMELEHQALIYKYINANVPIPSNLLIPIRKALHPSGFPGFYGSFRPNALGWGSFHLGFSGNNDPEPGRCRRTDGKKWRCSRDAVADQKYCERHMNRGRHRSRKPVEGQVGHAATGPATTKVVSMASSPSFVASGGGASSNLNVAQKQVKNLPPSAVDASSNLHMNRISLNNGSAGGRLYDSQGLSMLSPATNMNSKDTSFSMLKQHIPCEESSRSEFGLISSDSLLSNSQRGSYIDCRKFGRSPDLNNQEPRAQDPVRCFIDDWPKNQSDSSMISWPGIEETQGDRTQLSISIPMSSDFSSSSPSPTHEKLALSPLRLSREFDPIEMGLGVGSFSDEPTQREVNWIPISWESSMGGPLGEVLNHTSNVSVNHKSSSSTLNLMTEGWDAGLQMELSPTGVLQKTSFGSLSNSSAGSSPRAEVNKTPEGESFYDSMLGPSFMKSSSIPSL
ncbi:hypothetical protein AQUCO_03700140v1 [Aquilegia coerulea]|uniref:Growth-regulating factor n=1 Tax=Aquilegia coerulea TaxID=218851 RepID=A0A2G5CTP5_AQUCA|nr:hypothetical protein AQUCO_03700140v1 [Aquilegia coerulea]